MNVSCGIVLATSDGWLICHSTGNKHWDFPKGMMEGDEGCLEAAIRELKEEAGVDLLEKKDDVVLSKDLGRHSYSSSKDLRLFYVYLKGKLDVSLLECTSMFEMKSKWAPSRMMPEMDRFEFKYPDDAIPMLGKSMQEWVKSHVPAELLDVVSLYKLTKEPS